MPDIMKLNHVYLLSSQHVHRRDVDFAELGKRKKRCRKPACYLLFYTAAHCFNCATTEPQIWAEIRILWGLGQQQIWQYKIEILLLVSLETSWLQDNRSQRCSRLHIFGTISFFLGKQIIKKKYSLELKEKIKSQLSND